jgi:glycosyltransferase involved in cell wall biosynthesis
MIIDSAQRVSVIIPAFNYGPFIGHALESLLAQQYQHWECIVIDDGSQDNTAEIAQSYVKRDTRIVYVHQKHGGISKARNAGLSCARGQYIQFLDADDMLEDRKLQCHVQYLENNPGIDLVYGEARYFRTERPEERRYSMAVVDVPWMPKISGSGTEILETLLNMNIMVVSAPLLRRQVVDRTGAFDKRLSSLADWYYWLRCATNGFRFQYMNETGTLSLIRWHPDSLIHDEFKRSKDESRMRQKLCRVLKDKSLVAYNRSTLAKCDGFFGIELVKAGRLFRGIWRLLNASYRSSRWKDSLRWAYSAIVAPFAPRRNFYRVARLPLRESLKLILRMGE